MPDEKWHTGTRQSQSWRHHCVLPALLLGCAGAWDAQGAELGSLTVHSWLGRQLKASVLLAGDDARESESRCYKASLLNLNNEALGSLKATVQHSAKGSILLLFGGDAVDEPAAMVKVENTCGTGGAREYALLLDQVPDAQKIAEPYAEPLPAGEGRQVEARKVHDGGQAKATVTVPESTIQPVRSLPQDIVSAATGMMRLAALLPASHAGATRSPSMRAAVANMDAEHRPSLKLAHSLGTAGTAAGKPGEGSSQHPGVVASVLTLLAVLCATAWIAMRIRSMNASGKAWVPADTA